jgi:hypothetical protein
MRPVLSTWSSRMAQATSALWWCRPVVATPALTAWAEAPLSLHVAAGWLALLWGTWHSHALSWQVDTHGWAVWRWHPATGSRARFLLMGALLQSALAAGLCRVPWRVAAPAPAGRTLAMLGVFTASMAVVGTTTAWGRVARRALKEQMMATTAWTRARLRRVR